jgi:hypothetical protein
VSIRRALAGALTGALLLAVPAPVYAGPPYETDDPEPTDLGHWEIYGFAALDGRRHDLDGVAGVDLNYGAVKDLQLTATLPIAFEDTSAGGWRSGAGDLELGAKYRFVNDEGRGIEAAIFPRVILPTSDRDLGSHRVRLLLPLWLQRDFGSTSVFGGGGYEINPGGGNKDFWQAGLAVTHDFSKTLSLGSEVTWQSADTVGGDSTTGVNVGIIRKLGGPYSLLVAAGPGFSGGHTIYHSYVALALDF